MKKLLIVVFMLLSGTALMAQTDAAAKTSGASFKFEEMEFNFGQIKQGDKVGHKFKFINNGTEPLIISQAQGSCGCTVPEWPKQPLKPGESGIIDVTFDSAGKMGVQDKTVTITSNAATNPVVLHIKGTVEAAPTNATQESKPMEKHQH